MKFAAKLLATTLLSSAPAWAQPADADTAQQPQTGPHIGGGPEIVVTAPFVRELDVISGRSVLDGDDLVRDIRPQIGETLTRLPGVSATSFAPGASRPVLRGFQGERIRVLTDGIGTLDVSNTSADHAVTIDPLTTERVEVLRGPAVLLFGSQAIGGAVNVLDRRIPRALPENGFHLDAIGALGSAAEEIGAGAGVDVALGNSGFVLHLDGSYRETSDLDVGGFVLSPRARAEQLEIAAEEAEEGHLEEAEEATEFANLRGTLPNSATETQTLGGGLAYIGGRGSLGFSVGYFDTRYGVPARPGGGHHHEEEEGEAAEGEEEGHEEGVPVSIDLQQLRADVRAEVIAGGGFLDRIRVRLGYADYEHIEFEGDEVGTVFLSDSMEGRLELVQAERGGWRGVIGAQGFVRDFAATGAEAFVPPNETTQIGLFTIQEFTLGDIGLEAAARYERSSASADAVRLSLGEVAQTISVDRNFDAFSAALGASYSVTPTFRIGVNASRSERAPSGEELFSNGPHIATQAFEVGNPFFDTEKSLGVELYARGELGPVTFSASAYANWFDDFIYDVETGEEEDELPVFQYVQEDANYMGFEVEASARLFQAGRFAIVADAVADYVEAEVADGTPLPRIPPLRLLGGLEAQSDNLTGRVEVEHAFEQDRVAAFEEPTDAFTLVNASIAWRPWANRETVLILSGNNLFDVDARRHASFTKEFVPLPGRDIRLSARFSF